MGLKSPETLANVVMFAGATTRARRSCERGVSVTPTARPAAAGTSTGTESEPMRPRMAKRSWKKPISCPSW